MTDPAEKDNVGLAEVRPSNSELYPWYDSIWLSKYVKAREIIREVRAEGL